MTPDHPTITGSHRVELGEKLGSRMERAVWVPGWYGLDEPLAVGETREFAFWRHPPQGLRGRAEELVFYNTLWGSEDALIGSGTVVAISNAELGEIREIDTRSEPLDYLIHLADGTTLDVNAEEEPGRLYDGAQWSSRVVNDWRMSVEFDPLSELRLLPRRPRRSDQHLTSEQAAPPFGCRRWWQVRRHQ